MSELPAFIRMRGKDGGGVCVPNHWTPAEVRAAVRAMPGHEQTDIVEKSVVDCEHLSDEQRKHYLLK